MRKIKTFVINGKKFNDIEGFYKESVRILAPGFIGFGRNPDAFDDILYGGEEPFDFKEKIILVWKNFDKSKKELPQAFLRDIVEIIRNHKYHVKFKRIQK